MMDMMSVAEIVVNCFCNLVNAEFMDDMNSFKSVLLKSNANIIAIA